MDIIAKFSCESVVPDCGAEQVTLRAVTGGSDENKSFSDATPSATVNMRISNPGAQGFFIPGSEYFCKFSEANPKDL